MDGGDTHPQDTHHSMNIAIEIKAGFLFSFCFAGKLLPV
jgi:hypothetical protein